MGYFIQRWTFLAAVFVGVWGLWGVNDARADGILDVYSLPVPFPSWATRFDRDTLFPNWELTPTSHFVIVVKDDLDGVCTDNPNITGLTILNYGTADGVNDIQDMYFGMGCGVSKKFTGYQTMTYAGLWTIDASTYPAWTWAGLHKYVDKKDPCDVWVFASCACNVSLYLYTDLGPCPTDGATIELGPAYNPLLDPGRPGGISDACDFFAPWGVVKDTAVKTIRYAVKKGDRDLAAPGDTINYTITYGLPGTAPLTNIVIFDTIPQYTHLVSTGTPAPDPGWAPEFQPGYIRLRWTRTAAGTAGGPTAEVTFAVTVDWGNGDAFEFGSGDIAAPEGMQIQNDAQVFFNWTDCPQKVASPPPWSTTVRRFIMWKIGDNDMLFAPTPGQPQDEMIYSIFIKNISTSKTWWDMTIWDTVPADLISWCSGCGFEDPCLGWTMTPSGCAAASPGMVLSGSDTLLTWRLTLPPGATIELRWKAKVKITATANSTAIGIASVLAYGRTGIFGGTGHSGVPRTFAHLAGIILPTTYISYVGYGSVNYRTEYALDFYPLNKKTQFVLYGLVYMGAGYATTGGVSASIGCYIGDCISGFFGNGGPCPILPVLAPTGGNAGCKAERVPAQYLYTPPGSPMPYNNLYKVVSNTPLAWQVLTERDSRAADHMTFAPSSTMTYTGLMHYYWRRTVSDYQVPGSGDQITFISTGKDPFGTYDPGLRTTVHEFQFDFVTLRWQYRRTYELGPESMALDSGTLTADEGPWRSISSAAQLIVNHAYQFHTATECCCGACGHNASSLWPTRERGNVVVGAGETAYGLVSGDRDQSTPTLAVGNMGTTDAVYDVFRYVPVTNVPIGVPGMPNDLRGTNGMWVSAGTITTPFGMADPDNPYVFPDDGGQFSTGSTALFKVKLVSGGPIQIYGGIGPFSAWGHGAVLHTINPLGEQTGIEYWVHHTYYNEWGGSKTDCAPSTHVFDIFCPRTGMTVNAISENGMSATYTTTGPDQCVAFRGLSNEPGGTKATVGETNYKINVLANPAQGGVVAMYFSCGAEKGFTAPFMSKGVRYDITAPPVVFVGQTFWITIVVFDATNTTKTDYDGTTTFTSTDSTATMTDSTVTSPGSLGGVTYTWSPGTDAGVKIFYQVTMSTVGIQTIVATDLNDGSIVGLTAIMVVAVDVKLTKEPRLAIAASGDTVQFKICWSNYSSATAFDFTVTDAVPEGTAYVPEAGNVALCGSTNVKTYGTDYVLAYSTSTSATPPAGFTTISSPGTSSPPAAVRWLRWTVREVGVNTTGCLCLSVKVE